MKVNLRKFYFITFISIITLSIAIVLSGCSRDKVNKVIIKGSTTVLPITMKITEEYAKIEKDLVISVEGSGSGNGIKALIDGNCDIANSSREMKPKELKLAKTKGIDVREIAIAYDMIVPVVHPSNPINNIKMNQLKAIYAGDISNWKDIGGKDDKAVVVSRDTSSGTYEIWHKKVMKKMDTRKDSLLQASNGAIITTVSQNKRAIGYIGYGYLNNTVKALRVNGIEGTIENGKSGKYPISRKLYIYVNNAAISEDTKKFIDFILGSQGQKLVKEAGFIPL
ncbi:MAG: PstS family phosphate ABC transporter substrate-binding protein [Spirochaetota bacterium]|nr:PstS family phosphate ABC transporter substrate-binding protein [Spirochaetota bacterium]